MKYKCSYNNLRSFIGSNRWNKNKFIIEEGVLMNNEKLETISNLFDGKEIRSVWDAQKENYEYAVLTIH